MTVVEKIDLENAKVDTDDLGEIINSDSTTTVSTRLGETVKSVAKAIGEISTYDDKGAWLTSTAYVIKDLVQESGTTYICTVPHTSGTFATDLAAGKWGIFQTQAPEVLLSGYASLSAAITGIASSTVTLVVDKDDTLSGDTVSPANIALRGVNGKQISTGTHQLTWSGPIVAEKTQIFDTSGGGSVIGLNLANGVSPEWFGLSTLDLLQAELATNTSEVNQNTYGRFALINSRSDSGGGFDSANFAGQTDYGNEPIGFVFHHYTDGTMKQMDNVGEDNTILVLKNAQNAGRRPDKPSSFVGSGTFVKCTEHDDTLGYSQTLGFIDKAFKFVWTGVKAGSAGIATMLQNKTDDGLTAFRMETTNKLQYLWDFVNDTDAVLQIKNDVTYTRAAIVSAAAQTSGMFLEALAGKIRLKSSDGIEVQGDTNSKVSGATGNLQLTTNSASGMVESLTPFKLRVYSTGTLPAAGTFQYCTVCLSDYSGKASPLVWSDGTNWRYMDNTTV